MGEEGKRRRERRMGSGGKGERGGEWKVGKGDTSEANTYDTIAYLHTYVVP